MSTSNNGSSVNKWTQEEAIDLCRKVEAVCPDKGFHVALTGGLLYKDGERKDCDLLFYKIRQRMDADVDDLFVALGLIGLQYESGFGWCNKATFNGKHVDCFFPDENQGDHSSGPEVENVKVAQEASKDVIF